MARISHKSLRERLSTVVELASAAGLPLYVNQYGAPGRAGAVDVSASGYGYSVEMTILPGSSGVDLLSPSGMTATEADHFLRGMATALDLRRSLEHRRIASAPVSFECQESRDLELYVQNDSALWPRIQRTLARRYRENMFSLDGAITYIARAGCLPAAKDYAKQFGKMADTHETMFPKQVKLAAAESLARYLVDEFKLGNF